jgi:hypothetical protein
LARLAEREDADRVLVADLEELRERLRAESKGG